ncbi:MAG TPA: DUF2306 domain-containing protein [Ktedonobacteraceae bacterium]|jgi:uncharacterized membrane protein|nr:DUF2306 domain-containing protein [Ktedonobacteraceae bacterium]
MNTTHEAQELASTAPRKKPISRGIIPWIIMTVLAIGITIYATPYITFNPAVSRIPLNPAAAWHFTIHAIHAITGGTALLVGPFQFLNRFRVRYPAAHRVMGRIYMICVAIGSLAALYSAFVSLDGFVAQVGFVFLAIIWFYSVLQAYRAIRRGNIQLHRIWMIRNYALTFAAVILRIWLFSGIAYLVATHNYHGSPTYTPVYVSAVWFSWTSTLIFAEWFINQRFFPSRSR